MPKKRSGTSSLPISSIAHRSSSSISPPPSSPLIWATATSASNGYLQPFSSPRSTPSAVSISTTTATPTSSSAATSSASCPSSAVSMAPSEMSSLATEKEISNASTPLAPDSISPARSGTSSLSLLKIAYIYCSFKTANSPHSMQSIQNKKGPTPASPRAYFYLASLLLLLAACRQTQKPTLFELMPNTGVQFANTVWNKPDFNIFTYRNFYNGGGVAIGDINNDGLPDIFFTSNMGGNKLFLNKGNFRFEDISAKAGFPDTKPQWSTGVV